MMHTAWPTPPQSTDSTLLSHTPAVAREDSVRSDSTTPTTKVKAAAPTPAPAYLTAQGAQAQAQTHRINYTPTPLDSVMQQAAWPLTSTLQEAGLTQAHILPSDAPAHHLGYSLRTDSWVSGALLLTFFLSAYTMARALRFLRQQFKDFFHLRERANLFAHAADNQFTGWFYLLIQFSLIVALIYFDYTATLHPDHLTAVSPYLLIGTSATVAIAYSLIKLLLYGWVGHTFFEYEQRTLWRKAFTLSQLAEALMLFVLLLLIVYFNLSQEASFAALCTVLGIVLAIRWYKLQTIFFAYRFGYVHGILYFCTLEIMPLVGLWYALTYTEALAAAYF